MKKVITYGTYDLLHFGHIRLLERAKELGDYLIVGVTADDFDKTRGKINVKQSLMERIEAVRATGLADEIIVEEYEGQKIDDIRRYDVDIFTVGSDWVGKFDYLSEYCEVVYLERTEGVSSSELRSEKRQVRLGILGRESYLDKFIRECRYVNGLQVVGVCSNDAEKLRERFPDMEVVTDDYDVLLDQVDAVYIISRPKHHHAQIRRALERNKHVLCESPVTLRAEESRELYEFAKEQGCVLMEALKTAFSTAYSRLLLLVKTGKIGQVVSVDATCTSLRDISKMDEKQKNNTWSAVTAWGPTALLPIFQILGHNYNDMRMVTRLFPGEEEYDAYTRMDFIYPRAVASARVGSGVKSEGELVISGTKGYIYVPAPWWKTDYFEIRYENPENNQRYFYQLDGEGIRYEVVAFVKAIETGKTSSYISQATTEAISAVMDEFMNKNYTEI